MPDNSSLIISGAHTLSAWINVNSFNLLGGIIGKYHTVGAYNYYLRLHLTSPFKGICFGSGSDLYTGNNILSTNTWYHVVGVQYPDQSRVIYINGISTASDSGQSFPNGANTDPVTIGVDYLLDPRYFDGKIDEVRIYNRSLTEQEVYELYASNLQKFNSTQWHLNVNQSKNATAVLDDGTYTYQTFAENLSGSINNTEMRTFTVDTTPPDVTINTPSNGSTINNRTPELNATFGGETVAYAWYNVNNTGNSTPVSNINNLNVTLLSLPSGAHNITVYANDSVGNLNSSIVYFTVDTSSPVVTASKSYSDYAQINPMTIDSNITVTDADTNVTGARVSIGDGYVSSEDYLNYTTLNGITGSYSMTTGILTLTGNRSGSDYQYAFRNVTYWNSNTNNPNTSQRNITFAIGNNSLYFPGTGHYYEFVSPALTWTNAKTAADAKTFVPTHVLEDF